MIYAEVENGAQKGCIDLTGARWQVSPKDPLMFEIATPKRTYQLIAATKAETRCWLAKLSYRDEQSVRNSYVDPMTGQVTERVNARKQEMLDMVLQAEARAAELGAQVLAGPEPEPELEPVVVAAMATPRVPVPPFDAASAAFTSSPPASPFSQMDRDPSGLGLPPASTSPKPLDGS